MLTLGPNRTMGLDDKSKWYRLPERELRSAKVPAPLQVGDVVRFRRVIARCGYYNQPTDMPIEEMNQVAIALICSWTGLDEETVEKVVTALHAGCYHYDTYPLVNVPPVEGYMHHYPRSDKEYLPPLRRVYYKVRGQWRHHQPIPDATATGLRTFWYIDLDEPTETQITDKVMRIIGKYDPGGGYTRYGDWDPPSLWEQLRQQLYVVAVPDTARFSWDWTRAFVHPSDAELIYSDNRGDR